MRVFKFTLMAAFCLMATFTQAAGFRFIRVPRRWCAGAMLQAAVWYPVPRSGGRKVKLP